MIDIAVLVSTHDRYRAAWPVFCHGMHTYWPDCPWPVKATTNRLDFPCGAGLKIGGDCDWSENIRRGLTAIGSELVLLLLEDTWITSPVDTGTLTDFARHIEAGRTDYIRLVRTGSQIVGDPAPFDGRLFAPDARSHYRTAICPTIWRAQVLYDLIRSGETVHGFELRNDPEAATYHCVYAEDSVYLPHVFPTASGCWSWSPIQQGRWTAGAYEYVRREGLPSLTGDTVYEYEGAA